MPPKNKKKGGGAETPRTEPSTPLSLDFDGFAELYNQILELASREDPQKIAIRNLLAEVK